MLAAVRSTSDAATGLVAVGFICLVVVALTRGVKGIVALAAGVIGVLVIGNASPNWTAPPTMYHQVGLAGIGLVIGCLIAASMSRRGVSP